MDIPTIAKMKNLGKCRAHWRDGAIATSARGLFAGKREESTGGQSDRLTVEGPLLIDRPLDWSIVATIVIRALDHCRRAKFCVLRTCQDEWGRQKHRAEGHQGHRLGLLGEGRGERWGSQGAWSVAPLLRWCFEHFGDQVQHGEIDFAVWWIRCLSSLGFDASSREFLTADHAAFRFVQLIRFCQRSPSFLSLTGSLRDSWLRDFEKRWILVLDVWKVLVFLSGS